jgi:hypothetical protein
MVLLSTTPAKKIDISGDAAKDSRKRIIGQIFTGIS